MDYAQKDSGIWVEIKQKLRTELLNVKQSFVRIGYVLRKIEDTKLYEQDGYKSMTEFAKAEYGLEASTVSRFVNINREYSVEGYSETLRPEYAELGRSQLEEMLKLSDDDRRMVQPETSREDIRELKRFNKAEPKPGVADDLLKLVENFYRDHLDVRTAVLQAPEFEEQNIGQFVEIVNPGGNRSYRKGLFFMMMYDDRVVVKRFGESPQDMTWLEFYRMTMEILRDEIAPAQNLEEEQEDLDDRSVAEEVIEDNAEDVSGHEPSEREEKKILKEEIAPVQKNIEVPREANRVLEGYETRKEYMDRLSAHEMAAYIACEYERHSLKASSLAFPGELEEWLLQEVDRSGRKILEG